MPGGARTGFISHFPCGLYPLLLLLLLRYLIPCSHLSRKQHCFLTQKDCCSSSASSFLLLLPSWCPGDLHNTQSEHIHWPKGADVSVSNSVGYCRGSDFLMDVNYLHYLWDARQAISVSTRACQFWSAPYDGIDPPPQQYRSDMPGDDADDDEELINRGKSDSICSLLIAPSPSALSPAPSSLDNSQMGRTSSALELEWDDIFADDDFAPSAAINTVIANGGVTLCTVSPAPPPKHIQEMRRNATKLVQGSYVEESEFQDDVLAYDLVAQKDTKRIIAANRWSRGSISKPQRAAASMTVTAMLTTTGRTVMETVNGIMSTRRRSEDAGKEERSRSDYSKEVRRRSEDCGKKIKGTKESAEDELKRIVGQGEPPGFQLFNNSFHVKNHIIGECDDSYQTFNQNCNRSDPIPCVNLIPLTHKQPVNHKTQQFSSSLTNSLLSDHHLPEPCDLSSDAKSPNFSEDKVTRNDFLSQYHELMLSLGVQPDSEDVTDNISTFRERVQALREKLEEDEEEGLGREFDFNFSGEDAEDEGEEDVMQEEEEMSRRYGVPFTGPFISVLLSRLENLLENSIAVNLLVTGILSQLASYPQPLLRSFLLITDTHSQPNIRTLYQVLESVHAQIERYVAERPDYPTLVTQAWRFLLAKDQESKFRECLQSQGGDIILDPSLPNGLVKNALALPPLSVLPPCPMIPPQAKSRVFAIVLYAEFLKELAAIAQEHIIAPDHSSEE